MIFFRFIGRQEWLRFGIRDRLIRAYCNPDTVKSNRFVIDFFTLKYKGNLNSFIDWSVYFYGAYEKQYLYFLRSLCTTTLESNTNTDKNIFIDIGANVGNHSLYMSQYCNEIHSFEPNLNLVEKFKENIVLNNLSNITVHDLGLGDTTKKLEFYFPVGCNQGTGSFVKNHSYSNKKEMLNVVNGDEYIKGLQLKNINLIKIDVEGFEKKTLIGLKDTLIKFKPYVVVEFSKKTQESFEDLDELISLFPTGYKIKLIRSNCPVYKIFNLKKVKLVDFNFNISGGDLLFYIDGQKNI